jgi:CheY-like chemotaxis protein
MDLQMPKVDGIQAAWSIRRLPRHAKTPILAMSGNVFEDDRQRCKDAGMNDFIAKPVRPQALLSALRRWQGGARAAPLASGT